ncbi:RNA polymerase-binding transcription factor DksA [Paenibacillus plantiphilus]|uniref:RNA polymerase-binding transcription factor DksA n=1 Tax=Paenibacillus plantiphilus TaxID=2905650 RepID=A0ABM9CH44_9BACL|nr:TraR/DksA C4-type zinc finger protein [Paenibacillus plantiphilus]CAH1213688.1 RNA polymerase-binding transcription factor DksA [Paenibacillus plantiphilus]
MPHLTRKQIDHLRRRLQSDKTMTEKRLADSEHYGLASSLRDETGELSTMDNHPADLATEMYERGKDIALLEQEDLRLSRIETALTAMSSGTYGTCLSCGIPIPFKRLQALPDTLHCIDHAPRQEPSDRRPIEEQFLTPPFGRSSLDEREGYNGFDGEDAWQIVEQWGNSDSPAMSENRDVFSYDDIGIEADEADGYVEPLESFLATDITGTYVSVIRNKAYYEYLDHKEGDYGLEQD